VLDQPRFDQLQGAILPDGAGGWRYQLDGAVFYNGDRTPEDKAVLSGLSDLRSAAVIADLPWRDDALAFAKFEALLRSKGQWSNPKPWLLTFLRGSNAEQIVREIMDGLTGADVGPFGRITCYPMRTSACRTPLFRLPEENIVFPFNIIRIPPSDDAATAQRMVAQNRALYVRIRDAGGVQYPVGAFPMSHSDWGSHFGSSWPRFLEIKRRCDPANALAPGYGIF
jgi:FAD/FMN-containing dehydrogenase